MKDGLVKWTGLQKFNEDFLSWSHPSPRGDVLKPIEYYYPFLDASDKVTMNVYTGGSYPRVDYWYRLLVSEFLEHPYRDKFGLTIDDAYDMPVYRWKLLQNRMSAYIKQKQHEESVKRRQEGDKGK